MEGTPFTPRPTILNRDRTLTNRILFIFYLIMLLIWFPIVIYAFCVGDGSKIFPTTKVQFTASSFFIILGYSLLTGLFAMLVFAALAYIKNFSYVLLLIFWIPVVSGISAVALDVNFYNIWAMFGAIFSFVFIIYLLNVEWLHLPEGILKESCKVILFFPTGMLVSILVCLLGLLIAVTGTVALLYFMTLPGSFFIVLLQLLNVITTMWTVLVVFYIGQMVLSGAYATWFWTTNKREIPKSTVLKSFKMVMTNHVGTAAFATSIFGVGYSIYLAIAHAIGRLFSDFSGSFLCFVVYNLFDAIVVRFVSLGASIKCVTDGTNYQESATKAISGLEEHPKRCLVVVKVIEYVMAFAAFLLLLCSLLSVYGFMPFALSPSAAMTGIMPAILCGVLLFGVPLFSMLTTAYFTILFCVIEDLESSNGSEERPYAMSAELQEAVHHNGPPACWRTCCSCCGANNGP